MSKCLLSVLIYWRKIKKQIKIGVGNEYSKRAFTSSKRNSRVASGVYLEENINGKTRNYLQCIENGKKSK